MNCNICSTLLGDPIFESARSLTSLCDIYPGKTCIRICKQCGHVQTDSIENIECYYDKEYTILINSEEEDQIYEVREGKTIFRTEHQVNVFTSKIPLTKEIKILDFGCAKSSMMRTLHDKYPGIDLWLFDVSDRYTHFWGKFIQPGKWATYTIPDEWSGQFDIITSFFSLEHIVQPAEVLTQIHGLLKPGGLFYIIVPDIFTNIGDFLVIDHVNHFTKSSISQLLASTGFSVTEIDEDSHTGAFVIIAKSLNDHAAASLIQGNKYVKDEMNKINNITNYWTKLGKRIHKFESEISENATIAIYGAGFYGAFIRANLQNPNRIGYIIDQNPFLNNKNIDGIPVITPSELPENLDTVLVGLNPAHGHDIISGIPSLASRNINYFFL